MSLRLSHDDRGGDDRGGGDVLPCRQTLLLYLLLPTLCIVLFLPLFHPFGAAAHLYHQCQSGFSCHHNEFMFLYFDNCQIFDIWLQPGDGVVEALGQAQVFDKHYLSTFSICRSLDARVPRQVCIVSQKLQFSRWVRAFWGWQPPITYSHTP